MDSDIWNVRNECQSSDYDHSKVSIAISTSHFNFTALKFWPGLTFDCNHQVLNSFPCITEGYTHVLATHLFTDVVQCSWMLLPVVWEFYVFWILQFFHFITFPIPEDIWVNQTRDKIQDEIINTEIKNETQRKRQDLPTFLTSEIRKINCKDQWNWN